VQKSLELTASWHPSVRVLMEDQVVDAASTLAFLTSTPDFGTDWAAQVANTRGRVTLIGDSGHPMPPVGGVGANAGFQDSADLLSKLKDTASGSRKEQVTAYQDRMLERARPMVEMSAG